MGHTIVGHEQHGLKKTGFNKTGLNEMGMNKTDELIMNKMSVNDMGWETEKRHHYYHIKYDKRKDNEMPRKACLPLL